MKTTIIDPVTYPLSPDQINTRQHFFDGFGNREKEISANWIVRFCQQRGAGWQPFTAADINDFCRANGHPEQFWFNGLDKDNFLILEGGKFFFTHEFVSNCFRASPDI